MSEIVRQLPKMMLGRELHTALTVIPIYDEKIREADASTRLMALSDIYRLYIPSQMTMEIYSKLYLSILGSLQKKDTREAVIQRNENYRRIQGRECGGIMGGSDSYTIIGGSGIGKSSAIEQSIRVATDNVILQGENPYRKIIPCVICQCPHDCSVKGLLLEVLRQVDGIIGSKYYEQALRARATIDMLIGNVSQVALNHVGLLVVDEIQNVCSHRNGTNLVSMLTQLINSSGISICMVGTPESAIFFEQKMQLARRSLGLQYHALPYDTYFKDFCRIVYRYQYVKNSSDITDMLIQWLYEHSSGFISMVVSLVHDAQELAILSGKEILNLETLDMAYQERLKMMHGYIKPSISINKQTNVTKKKSQDKKSCEKKLVSVKLKVCENQINIYEFIIDRRGADNDMAELLKEYISVWEVVV